MCDGAIRGLPRVVGPWRGVAEGSTGLLCDHGRVTALSGPSEHQEMFPQPGRDSDGLPRPLWIFPLYLLKNEPKPRRRPELT